MAGTLERLNTRRVYVRTSAYWKSQSLVRAIAEDERLEVARDELQADLIVIVVRCIADLRAIDPPRGRLLIVAEWNVCEKALRRKGACARRP